MASALVLATVVVLLVYMMNKFIASRRIVWRLQKAGLPMPKYNAIFGHFLELGKHMQAQPPDATFNISLLEMAKDFPDGLFCIDFWPIAAPMLITNRIGPATQLANAPLSKIKEVNKAMNDMTGGLSLFSMPDGPWKYWRSLFNPGFSAGAMLDFVPAIAQEVQVFSELLRKQTLSPDLFYLEELTLKLSVDVIGAVSVDNRWHYQLCNHPLASALRTQIEWASFGTELNPFSRFNPVRRPLLWFNNRRLDRLVHGEIMSRFTELRVENENQSNKSLKKARSIVSLALQEYLKQTDGTTPNALDEKFLSAASAQLRLFLIAGHDTTSTALIYCYHTLATHPECLARIRAEHDAVFGTDLSLVAEKLTETPALLNQLPYTLAVIKEALRLNPPASLLRQGSREFNIVDDNGKIFPTEDCYIWVVGLLIQRNPKYFKDPDSFIPDRWLVEPGDSLYPPKGAWRPFETGPRNCLGQTLAMTELKVVLAMTIREFDIKPAYKEWDKKNGTKGNKTALGTRAYHVERGGGGAHPADQYPCIVTQRQSR